MKWNNFEFHSPEFLWLLILIPLLAFWNFYSRKKDSAQLTISSVKGFKINGGILPKLKPLLYIFRLLALACLIVGLARPRNVAVSKKTKSNKGIDIVMAIDVSASMLAKDLKPNRLEALKKVAVDFVNRRPNDRIGIVVYAGESFTQTPITSDKSIVKRTISEIKWGQLDGGTAIGMGLGSAVNRLKESKAKSKVIILLTDGVNNAGFVDPKTATELAKGNGIKVYTIGIGTNGMAPFPWAKDPRTGKISFRNQQVEIDEKLLKHIAKETDGKYFRATDNSKLKAIYSEINKLEKTKIEEFKYYNYTENYRLLVFIAGIFLLLEFLLKNTLFKSFI
ncbi:vWA domain-containing protein [Tenacibaculum finnmarkense]|uniref:VWA domain-containing protein n=1 Tax=Tenacibaculum finnmarkense genomovar finnmarkense TaxID=1458503 RepID=A0AAP1WF77_9FLAO|nr:VWA domain-containing protein [Tenacibaculum finnmarkense]MBE7651622.1 VWA domain-containing protein [Tenacibaculum finnmarkense genomovar finnmarkense]MBE7694029.1 VWA domain-containing protein [Tenacibaculum finnmarkense genomovar finnmarkense]MCD8426540.1 VWA domain-containing protein [Tenacibaculum finnmarkense genomovar finnmarkense]MCG8205894.1 VWA domain-containing protein [Tenacibaculum finnmarkense genomovar finnmarkense]MCG8722035.1 VWA domain-containing protein [Tenacibaculum fin